MNVLPRSYDIVRTTSEPVVMVAVWDVTPVKLTKPLAASVIDAV